MIPERAPFYPPTQRQRPVEGREWEAIVRRDLVARGFSVTDSGDEIPPNLRRAALRNPRLTSIRYVPDFLVLDESMPSGGFWVDAKATGDVSYWSAIKSDHRHLIKGVEHEHYLRLGRTDGLPVLYAFPCGLPCGHDEPLPSPRYVAVETFERDKYPAFDANGRSIIEDGSPGLFVNHAPTKRCRTTPESAIRDGYAQEDIFDLLEGEVS